MDILEHTPDVLTIPEAAETLKLSVSAMQSLIETGEIEHVVIADQPLIFKPFLISYIEKLREACYTESADASKAPQGHLGNRIEQDIPPSQGGNSEMAKYKFNQSVTINGAKRWITANSTQELIDKAMTLALAEAPQDRSKHPFEEYAWNWYNTYSAPNVETATATTYKRQIRLYLIPAFDGLAVEDITVDDVQRLFNSMSGAKATKDKARMVLNQILDAAVEDKLLSANPLKSRRLKISGKASKAIEPYTVEQMRYIVQHIGDIQKPADRMFLAILALHPLRLEEVLGLAPKDVDTDSSTIQIQRAVTHPYRNQPEVKDTKTDGSHRTVGLSTLALPYLQIPSEGEFLFGGNKPLSYMQVRRMCWRIQKDIGFNDNITPIRFRTTILTDMYDQTKDIKLAQAAAGHTTSAMTLKYYVKGRETSSKGADAVDKLYSA